MGNDLSKPPAHYFNYLLEDDDEDEEEEDMIIENLLKRKSKASNKEIYRKKIGILLSMKIPNKLLGGRTIWNLQN